MTFSLLFLTASLLTGWAAGDPIPNAYPWDSPLKYWPADANVANVKNFGAAGDGVTDDTRAIETAWINAGGSSTLYFPTGTYIVSKTLVSMLACIKSRIVQGECTTCSTIRLMDNAPGFNNTASPSPVVAFGQGVAQNFDSLIQDITISVGRGNPGAIGISAVINNQGGIRNVSIISEDGQGYAGLGVGLVGEPGPTLHKYISVTGFQWGVLVEHASAHATFEHVAVFNQTVCGFNNSQNVVTVRDLTSVQSSASVPGLCQGSNTTSIAPFFTLVDATLTTTQALKDENLTSSGSSPGIYTFAPSMMYLRNVAVHGYDLALYQVQCNNVSLNPTGCPTPNGPVTLPAPYIKEWTTHPVVSQWPGTPATSLNLTVVETPEPVEEDLSHWANALAGMGPEGCPKTGPKNSPDCTPLFVAAMASGASTIYFPSGGSEPTLYGTIPIPRTVRRIVGHATSVRGNATLVCEEGDESDGPLSFENWHPEYSPISFLHSCARDVVLWSMLGLGVVPADGKVGKRMAAERGLGAEAALGDVFIDDVCGPNAGTDSRGWRIAPGQHVWTRQLDTESKILDVFVEEGAVFWTLGWKTEGGESGLINATGAAAIEFLGCFNYMNGGDKTAPGWTIVDTPISLQWGGFPFDVGSHPFTRIINETHAGDTRVLYNTSTVPGLQTFPALPPAKRMALYVGLPKAQESLTQLEKAGLRWVEDDVQQRPRAGDVIATRYLQGIPSARIGLRRVEAAALPRSLRLPAPYSGAEQMLHATIQAASTITFYLSPDGNDTWSGSSSTVDNSTTPVTGPWASPARAQVGVRAALAQGAAGVYVYMSNGTYFLAEPLLLGPADSGTGGSSGSRVVWSRDPALPPLPQGQATDVIISGGQPPQQWNTYYPGVGSVKPPPAPKSPWSCKVEPDSGNSPYGLCSAYFNPPDNGTNSGVGPNEMYWPGGRARIRLGQSPMGPDPTLGWGWEALSSPNMTWDYLKPLDDTTAFAWFGVQFLSTNKSTARGPDQDWSGYSCQNTDPRIIMFHPSTASVHGIVDHDGGAFYKNGYFQFDSPTQVPISADGGVDGPAHARYLIQGLGSSCGFAFNMSGRFNLQGHDSGYYWAVNQLPGMNMSSTDPTLSDVVASRLPNVITLAGAAHVDFIGIGFQHASGARRTVCLPYAPCDAPANAWVNTAAVVITDGSRDVTLQHCDVSLNGGLGVLISNGTQSVTLSHCSLFDNGAGGMRVGAGLLPPGPPLPLPVGDITIANSTISVTGTLYPSAAGIHIGGAASHVTVTHCAVSNTTGPGIVLGVVPDGMNGAGSPLTAPEGIIVEYSRITAGGLYLVDVSSAVALYGPPGPAGLTLDHLILEDHFGWNLTGHAVAVLPGPTTVNSAPTSAASVVLSNSLCARTKSGLLAWDESVPVNVTVHNSIWASGAYNVLSPPLNPTQNGGLQALSAPTAAQGYLSFLTNIVLPDAQGASMFTGPWPAPTASAGYRFDSNVYYSPGAAVPMTFPSGLSGSAWQAAGQDVRGLIGTDPQVTGPQYIVPPSSPAVTQCGFVPIDYSNIGPQG